MSEEKKLKFTFYATLAYLFIFTTLAALEKNYEFLYYTIIFSILLFIAIFIYKKVHLPAQVIIGGTVVGALHFAGGLVRLNSGRLYELWLIPQVFKYDNLIHLLATFFVALLIYSFLYPHLYKDVRQNKFVLSLIIIFLAGGISAFNEVLELIAVLFFNAAEQVGDYYNNAFDLLFNFIGAAIACLFLILYFHRKTTAAK